MVAIIQFPGTNCEKDMQYSYEKIGAKTQIVWHKDCALPQGTRLVILPGGFSYGDYLRSGAIAARSPIMAAIKEFAKSGGFVLGICNGFQILCESGLLPGALKRNKNLHFISQNQNLKIINNDNAFLKNYAPDSEISLPIAHADGNYFVDSQTLEKMNENHQILMKYSPNPNGSIDDIACICNEQKNVFGLMPHPERAIEPALNNSQGLQMLKNIYEASKE